MFLAPIFVVLGLICLVAGADLAVGGARRMGRRLGISDLVIGLSVTSIGTSLPELATTSAAAVSATGAGGLDAAGLGMGNILGSNLFLMLALLGLSGVVRTLVIDARSLRRDGTAIAIATAAVVLFAWNGVVSRVEGGILAVGYLVYLVTLFRTETREEAVADEEIDGFFMDAMGVPAPLIDGLRVVVGLTVVVLGAAVVVQRGVELAGMIGVSAALIGVLAGVGTSLPEVVVSLRAATKGVADIAVGNILGSSIANLLLCLGVAAMAAPMPVPAGTTALDVPFLVAGTVMSLALMWERRDVTRLEGSALLTLFGLYLYLRATMI